ncbi:uncharacterized protein [Aristolochia californica]|uniref:uncharacterized protein n=1 Tax=Aristolochia californica TaxID=171875 RepID=UPI0035DCF9E9
MDSKWSIQDSLICYKQRIYLPTTSELIPAILSAYHDSTHEGLQKTLWHIRADFYWPAMKSSITTYVSDCHVCQRNKSDHLNPVGLLQPLTLPTQVWADISMDFVEGPPLSAGKSVLFVVVDRFSKYGHFIPMAHPYTAARVAQTFFEHIVRLHGIPESIVSDRDAIFTILSFLGSLWEGPPRLVSYTRGTIRVDAIDEAFMDRDQVLKMFTDLLQKAQDRMTTAYNKSHRGVSYAVGDYEWLCLWQYRQHSLAGPARHKLSPKYFGPFAIIRCVGPVAYQLKFPDTAKLHDVFHVSLLKPHKGPAPSSPPFLPPVDNGHVILTPYAVLQVRVTNDKWDILVQWPATDPEAMTWELLETFK